AERVQLGAAGAEIGGKRRRGRSGLGDWAFHARADRRMAASTKAKGALEQQIAPSAADGSLRIPWRRSMPPEARYAKSGEVNIAYQVVGEGPLDLVFVPGFVSHLDLQWAEPRIARFLEKLASFSRLILFDKRGTGLSDPVAGPAPLEDRIDDVRAVMDAVGSERAAVLGLSEGGAMSILFAATYPERTRALVLCGTFPTGTSDPDDNPGGQRWVDSIQLARETAEDWGEG